MDTDADVSVPAALIGNLARAAMLVSLLDGRSPSDELARIACVRASTPSEYLTSARCVTRGSTRSSPQRAAGTTPRGRLGVVVTELLVEPGVIARSQRPVLAG